MFEEDTILRDMAEEILSQFYLEDVLEMNDLSEEEALVILIKGGCIGEPERVVEFYSGPQGSSEEEV